MAQKAITSFRTARRTKRGRLARVPSTIVDFGQVFPDDDPIVRAYPHMFEPVVEKATAAPGEKRTVSKSATAKPAAAKTKAKATPKAKPKAKE